ncbi:hypothetical protein A9Q86_15580 [Flavobacteriales bacterium 33_180_T64]|nr:hypothetical protein A9Q86_15580 [Flavobacteriales bacterium 33_180_T64]
MKKTTLLMLLTCMLFTITAYTQGDAVAPSSAEEVEALFEVYYQNNQASTQVSFTFEELADQQHLSSWEKYQLLYQRKRTTLRIAFFEIYPEYKQFYQAYQLSLNSCFNDGFENGTLGFAFAKHEYGPGPISEQFNDCDMDINQNIPVFPGATNDISADASIVDGTGFDPSLLPYGVQLNRTSEGDFAMRLNSNMGGADIVTMQQLVTITDGLFVFDFAAVMQNPSNHDNEQPFFQVRILDSTGEVAVEACVVSDATNCVFIDTDPQDSNSPLYSEWSCFVLDTQALIGQTVTVEYSIADCGHSGHYGYVYIDDACQFACTDSDFGHINLDEINGSCPTFPIEVCGTYNAPLDTELLDMTLYIVDQFGFPTEVSSIPTLAGTTFCFTLPESAMPNLMDDFELRVVANYQTLCNVTPYTITLQDQSTNVGPDITFQNCCVGGAFPLNFGYTNRSQRRVSNVVVSTSGDTFVYLDDLYEQSPELTALQNTDFTDGAFILKFDDDECLVDYIEIPISPNFGSHYGDLQIDNEDNLYLTAMQNDKFIKLDENLNVLFNQDISITYQGNININDNQAPVPTGTSHLVYGYGSTDARFNGNFIVTPQPIQKKGPILTLVNTTTGVPFTPYVFDNTISGSSSFGPIIGDNIEVVGDQVFFMHRLGSGAGSTINFNGIIYTIPPTTSMFIAKFNIVGNVLQPDILVFSNQWYTNLEFNEQDNYLYAGNNNQIDVFDEDLNALTFSAALGGTTLNDMFFDYESETLLVATFGEEGNEEHLRMFDKTLGVPVWELAETLTGSFAGIYVPEVTRRGNDIYLVGIYRSTSPLINGLPESVDFDYYMERIDASVLPFTDGSHKKEIGEPVEKFMIYPNPSKGMLSVSVLEKNGNNSLVNISVLDFSGTTLFNQEKVSVLSDVTLNLNDLKPGMYFVRIANQKGENETHLFVIK